jgi:hypothetical protein
MQRGRCIIGRGGGIRRKSELQTFTGIGGASWSPAAKRLLSIRAMIDAN